MRTYRLNHTSWSRIVTLRAERPDALADRLSTRRQPEQTAARDGQLVLIDGNHRIDPRSGAYVDRRELLDRIVEALTVPEVDGVVASADVLEELTLLNVLDHRLAICAASGTSGYGGGVSGPTIVASKFDGASLSQTWSANGTPEHSLGAVSSDISDLAALGLPTMLNLELANAPGSSVFSTSWSDWIEPFHATVSSLSTGAGLWLTLPAIQGLPYLADASGFPLLVRDTDVPISPSAWTAFFGVELPNTIRGIITGCSALFPLDGTVAEATTQIARGVRSHAANEAA